MKCLTKQDKETQPLFLSLPAMLYKGDNPQNKQTELELLTGTHLLSGSFEVFPFVTADNQGNPLCRALLTCYLNDSVGYVGFFEAYDDPDGVQLLFDTIARHARERGLTSLMGPVDASIYMGYRFKTDRFEDYFTGEPYNKPYYSRLWRQAGFSVCNSYHSYRLRKVGREDSDEKLERLYQWCLKKGYTFSALQKQDFDKALVEIHSLMMKAYAEFAGFKPLTKEQFVAMFSYLKHVVDFDMVKLAYKDGKLCAFCICVPNYGKLTLGRRNWLKILRFLKIRRSCKEYVVLYLGADSASAGAGSALVHYVEKAICAKQCTSIAALIKAGGISATYYEKTHTAKFTYELFSRTIEQRDETYSSRRDIGYEK